MIRIRKHHTSGLINALLIAILVLILKFRVKFGLARLLCRRDRVNLILAVLVLVLLLVAVLVTWLEHLLNQFLPFRLFMHDLDIKLGYLIGILNANRHLLKLLVIRLLNLLYITLPVGHRVVPLCARMQSDHAGITLVEHELGRRLLPDFCMLCH